MILNLVPEFLDILAATDREAAYHSYLQRHRAMLTHYWRNYVIDPDSRAAADIIRPTLAADRRDLLRLVETVDLEQLAQDALDAAAAVLLPDHELDVCLMVGVGAANAGELVVGGRGVAVICVEHFTGQANPETFGLGLSPELLPLWIGHELAHVVRYCSPTSRADMRRLVAEAGGVYDCWELASRASLRELLVNEGIAVHASRAAVPGHAEEAYLGFSRRQFRRLRELETFLARGAQDDLDHTGLGLRLRYLTGGMTPAARLLHGRVLPERSGYYLGARMAEALVMERGIAEAARAPASEFAEAESRRAQQAASA
ncbi:MAG: DUF2268 domain-containing putative Zn-dependent protease [Gemmatimonadales bacterium]